MVTKIPILFSKSKPYHYMKKLFLWGILIGLSSWIPAQAQAQKGTTY